ncbi:hypothetical protein KI387_006939, partial [Taxus chinensis]
FDRDEWNGLYPFGIVFSSGYDPLVALGRMRVNLTDVVEAPLRKGPEVSCDL